jgi:hypothetical protein
MSNSALLIEVLSDHGLESIPSDETISQMNDHDKGRLYHLQRSVVSKFRDRWQAEVESLRQQVEDLRQMAARLGIAVGDTSSLDFIEKGLFEVEAIEDLPSPATVFEPEIQVKSVTVSPLVRKKPASVVVAPKLPVLSGRSRPFNQKCDFSNIDRRLKEINREILAISKRFNAIAARRNHPGMYRGHVSG